MSAVMAFRGRIRLRININRIIGAGLHTGFTADANAVIKFDNAVVALVHRLSGTNTDAGRIGAVITARYLEMAAIVGKCAGFDIFNPGAIHAQWHLILALTGGRASVTTNTLTVVDDKSIIFKSHESILSFPKVLYACCHNFPADNKNLERHYPNYAAKLVRNNLRSAVFTISLLFSYTIITNSNQTYPNACKIGSYYAGKNSRYRG
jgi:hypothetical protein